MAHKAPAFQFYPGDWFREPGLKRVDLSVRGAWAELLMIMWDETPQGRIETHVKGFAQTWRIDIPEACYIIRELDVNGIADVTYRDDNCRGLVQEAADFFCNLSPKCPDLSQFCTVYVSIKNRRMYNDYKHKENEKLKKRKQRAKKERPNSVPEMSPPLSSSSSSSSVNNKEDSKESSFVQRDKIAPDRQMATPLPPPVIKIPLVHKNGDGKPKEYPITQAMVDEWRDLFPGIDVMDELRKARAWSLANPTRRKTERGILRHLTTWLTKAQDRARASPYGKTFSDDFNEAARRAKEKLESEGYGDEV
ncbi:MAG: hypothetical protein JRJ79_17725 [Deltaproteobacteria bacterium]|nr:hypothetical protein [Deltaproteobacteria bacterium]